MKKKYYFLILITLLCLSFKSIPKREKGDLLLEASTPGVYSFLVAPEDEEAKVTNSFWGAGIGLDYYYSQKNFINLQATGAFGMVDFPIPIPAAMGQEAGYENVFSFSTSLSNNHVVKRFVVGYGLTYIVNYWGYEDFDTDEKNSKIYGALGFNFPLYFRLTRFFNTGVIYRPTFFRPMLEEKFKYEHLINLYLSFKFHLNKNRQKNRF